MRESDDDLRRLFAPLQVPTVPTDDEVRRVRRAAEAPRPDPRPSRPRRPRRRLLTAGATVMAAGLATAVIVTAVDRGSPGVFTGEAGARELLRSAADATRDDPTLKGWTLQTTTFVQRTPVEGRRCATCEVERGVLETRNVSRSWTGARGESYFQGGRIATDAAENEALLRATGALEPAPTSDDLPTTNLHYLPATGDPDEPDLDLFLPGAIVDPTTVPDTAAGVVDWLEARLRKQDALAVKNGDLEPGEVPPMGRVQDRVGAELVSFAVSPNLGGRQRAAAFDALAALPGVSVAPVPDALASDGRVGIRVPQPIAGASGAPEGVSAPQTSPLVVFDRDTRRIVSVLSDDAGPEVGTELSDGEDGATLRVLRGAAAETRYTTPVAVTGPGLDEDGDRKLRPGDAGDAGRNGEVLNP